MFDAININRVAFEIPLPQFMQNWFPSLGATLPIYWYGIIIVVGIALGAWWAARETITRPDSSGWRRASSAPRWNSGNSSRNRTPKWASDTSPGRGRVPPPTSAAMLAEWCGARNGRCLMSGVPAGSWSATE